MSSVLHILVFVAAIGISIAIGSKFKINIGMVAFAFAFLIGITFYGMSGKEVAALIPSNLFIIQLCATFFYGFASENGAIAGIAERIVYKSRGNKTILPIVLALSVFLVTIMGLGADAAAVVMSPIAFALAIELGFDPILASMAIWVGVTPVIGATWTPNGAVAYNIWAPHLGEAITNRLFVMVMIVLLLFGLVVMILVNKVYSSKHHADVTIKIPEKFTVVQKKALVIILATVVLLVIPGIVQMFFPNPITAWMNKRLPFQVICLVGAIICTGLKIADPKEVFQKRIPWNSIIMLLGMSTLMALAGKMGVVETISGWIGEFVPAWALPMMLVLIGGLMSYVVAASSVIYPLFAPIIPELATLSGVSPLVLALALICGACCTSFSPLSTGGVLAMLGANDTQREEITIRQFMYAIYFLGFFTCLFGIIGIFTK